MHSRVANKILMVCFHGKAGVRQLCLDQANVETADFGFQAGGSSDISLMGGFKFSADQST